MTRPLRQSPWILFLTAAGFVVSAGCSGSRDVTFGEELQRTGGSGIGSGNASTGPQANLPVQPNTNGKDPKGDSFVVEARCEEGRLSMRIEFLATGEWHSAETGPPVQGCETLARAIHQQTFPKSSPNKPVLEGGKHVRATCTKQRLDLGFELDDGPAFAFAMTAPTESGCNDLRDAINALKL